MSSYATFRGARDAHRNFAMMHGGFGPGIPFGGFAPGYVVGFPPRRRDRSPARRRSGSPARRSGSPARRSGSSFGSNVLKCIIPTKIETVNGSLKISEEDDPKLDLGKMELELLSSEKFNQDFMIKNTVDVGGTSYFKFVSKIRNSKHTYLRVNFTGNINKTKKKNDATPFEIFIDINLKKIFIFVAGVNKYFNFTNTGSLELSNLKKELDLIPMHFIKKENLKDKNLTEVIKKWNDTPNKETFWNK